MKPSWSVPVAAITLAMLLPEAAWSEAGRGGGDPLSAYARHKQGDARYTVRESLGFSLPLPYPEHGILVAQGGFFSSGAGWLVVDLDSGTVSRITTQTQTLPDNTRESYITQKVSRGLTAEETSGLIQLANDVWDPPAGHVGSGGMATDITCDVVLFDGPVVDHLAGSLCPEPALVKAVQRLQIAGPDHQP